MGPGRGREGGADGPPRPSPWVPGQLLAHRPACGPPQRLAPPRDMLRTAALAPAEAEARRQVSCAVPGCREAGAGSGGGAVVPAREARAAASSQSDPARAWDTCATSGARGGRWRPWAASQGPRPNPGCAPRLAQVTAPSTGAAWLGAQWARDALLPSGPAREAQAEGSCPLGAALRSGPFSHVKALSVLLGP